jgi:putative tonB protein|nr:energy transducer TonB [uncultured Capnocytophaga sp.]
MKKYTLILLTLLFVGFSYAQTEDKKEKTIKVATPPLFKECENNEMSKEEQYICFIKNLDRHVGKTFEYPEEAIKEHITGRVYITFCIRTDGSISVISIKSPHKLLENEGKRIIESLPTLIPAKDKDGKPVEITLNYPINFDLHG